MRIFFSLAPHFMGTSEYESGVRQMVKHFDLTPIFAHDAPADADPLDWISRNLVDCQYAFFDLTGLDPDVLFAFGVARRSDDVAAYGLVDVIEHQKSGTKAGRFGDRLIASARRFNDATDFQRRAHLLIADDMGSAHLRERATIATIKDAIRAKGPIYMRQIANTVGRPMPLVQTIVYELVRTGHVKKIGETSGSQYLVN